MREDLREKVEEAVRTIRKAERIAERMEAKLVLGFSGGKDSQAVYHLCKIANVSFTACYSVTTFDPPELVRFIRNRYPDVLMIRPEKTFLELVYHKGVLPTRHVRFCCEKLKENILHGVVLLGIRADESARRAKSWKVVNMSCNVTGKDDIKVCPILGWSEDDVFDFLREINVSVCELYLTHKRLGCLFCPVAGTKQRNIDARDYPKYKDAVIRTIERIKRTRPHVNWYYERMTAEQIFKWWISNEPIGVYFNALVNSGLIEKDAIV